MEDLPFQLSSAYRTIFLTPQELLAPLVSGRAVVSKTGLKRVYRKKVNLRSTGTSLALDFGSERFSYAYGTDAN